MQVTKVKLIQVLKDISSARSIWKTRKKGECSKDRFNCYLKLIREEGINAVTIHRDWYVDKLESINYI